MLNVDESRNFNAVFNNVTSPRADSSPGSSAGQTAFLLSVVN